MFCKIKISASNLCFTCKDEMFRITRWLCAHACVCVHVCMTMCRCGGNALLKRCVGVMADALSLQSCLAHVQQSSPFHSSGGRGGLGQPSLLKSVASVRS